jgi:hypothetical protein
MYIKLLISLLASIVVDREFEPRSGKTKDYQIGIAVSPLG